MIEKIKKTIVSDNYVEYFFISKSYAEDFWKTGVPLIGSFCDLLDNGENKKIIAAFTNIASSYEPKEYSVSIKYE